LTGERVATVDKSPDAFRTISEVAEDLDLPQHVLRFWETRFQQIKPLKRGGGRRYYRPDDVELLKGIRYYLYGEGYTIKGVQRILKERGIKHVVELGRAQTENYVPPVATLPRVADEDGRPAIDEWPEALPPEKLREGNARALSFTMVPDDEDEDPSPPRRPVAVAVEQAPATARGAPAPAPAAPPVVAPSPAQHRPDLHEAVAVSPRVATPSQTVPVGARVGSEGLRLLKAALFELNECKRVLDTTR
jgi:DNA-binding transcriptional MerR regulator